MSHEHCFEIQFAENHVSQRMTATNGYVLNAWQRKLQVGSLPFYIFLKVNMAFSEIIDSSVTEKKKKKEKDDMNVSYRISQRKFIY